MSKNHEFVPITNLNFKDENPDISDEDAVVINKYFKNGFEKITEANSRLESEIKSRRKNANGDSVSVKSNVKESFSMEKGWKYNFYIVATAIVLYILLSNAIFQGILNKLKITNVTAKLLVSALLFGIAFYLIKRGLID